MKIGIDLDGVIADLTPEFVTRLEKIGIKTNPHKWKTLYLENEIEGVTAEWMIEQINDPLFYMNVPAYEDAFYCINEWFYSGNDIYIITTRPESCLEVTQDWLDQWGIPYNKIVAGQKKLEKRHVASDLGVRVMIEDNPHEAYIMAQHGFDSHVITRPWNREYKSEGKPPFPLRSGDFYGITNLLVKDRTFNTRRKRV